MAKGRGRKVRVDLRKNRGKPGRGKSEWTRQHRGGDPKSDETKQVENVRAKGDLSRKRTIIIDDASAESQALQSGIVVTVRGLICEVDDGQRLWACTVRGMVRTRLIDERASVTVGDRVRFAPVAHGEEQGRTVSESRDLPEGVIEDVEPRRSVLERQYERRVQVIAANVDLVVIVMAADQPTLRPHLIDRYLVAVHKGGMRPAICINKADLDVESQAQVVVERYRGLGYKAFFTCVPENRGLDELRELLAGQTSTLVGPSGVGKSSLLNAIEPGFALKVGTLTDLSRGRHTTTTARLLRWSFGGYVVDTPGLRQFELASVDAQEVEAYFKEFVDLIQQCKYPNCSHTHEANCAIKAAVDDGRITPERYDSFCKMYEECAARRHYE